MKFLFFIAVLYNLAWSSFASPQPEHSRETTNNLQKRESKVFDKKVFEKESLNAHNDYRRIHNVPFLTWNETLATLAEEWAKHIVRYQQMSHRDQNTYGENIYYTVSFDPNYVVSGTKPVDMWYDEINMYDFDHGHFSSDTGHFTQIIWEDTKEVGVGMARSESGHISVVAYYYPRGNVPGQFTEKVHPPSTLIQHLQQDDKNPIIHFESGIFEILDPR